MGDEEAPVVLVGGLVFTAGGAPWWWRWTLAWGSLPESVAKCILRSNERT